MSLFTMMQSHVADEIYTLRFDKGWSQQKVADKLKTSRSQICRLEDADDCSPSIATLVKLAKIYRKKLVIEFVDRN